MPDPRRSKPTGSSGVTSDHRRVTNPATHSRHRALTWTYALTLDQLDARGWFLRHVPCGTPAHSLAPRTTHQDPDQVRTYPAWHSTFPLFIAGQERGQACTTSRPSICWAERAPRAGATPCPCPQSRVAKPGRPLTQFAYRATALSRSAPRCPSSTECSQHQVSTGRVSTGDDVGF